MKIAFYKKSGPGATFVDKLVCWWTKGDYSHVELIINDNVFYSCAPRDTVVRYKEINPNVKNWDIFNLTIPLDENKMRKNMDNQIGKKYDWLGIFFGQIFNYKKIHNPDRWICSELCSFILDKGGMTIPDDFITYSPKKLYEYLEKNNYVERS